ncbi:hypothetical protein LTS18_007208, partial [Coniosporium uncinatum]
MRSTFICSLAVAASIASAAVVPQAVSAADGLGTGEILWGMLTNPNLFPTARSYDAFKAILRPREKRDGPHGGAAEPQLGPILNAFKFYTDNLHAMTAKAPPTTVKKIQSGIEPTIWPTAKRTKVRYGPYRIPGITERNVQSLAIHNTTG